MQPKSGEWWPPRYTTMYFISLALIVASLPLSKFTMSLFQFSTLFFWLWHGVNTEFLKEYSSVSLWNPVNLGMFLVETIKNVFIALVQKFVQFFRNKPAMVITSILLLHVIGLIYTTDFNYALKDLRTKLPIFILPLFISTGPRISKKTFYWILVIFVAAVVGGSIYRLILLLHLSVADSRAIEAHTSHIRYSLNAVFAAFILFFFVYKRGLVSTGLKAVFSLVAIWIVGFMIYMNYTTGVLIFTFISFLLLVYFTFNLKGILLKAGMLLGIGIVFGLPLFYVWSIGYKYLNKPAVEFSKLDKFTSHGHSYYHDTVNFKSNNGRWIGLYICDQELRQAWAQRSKIPIDGYNQKNQLNRYTLIKYLASKDLRKDAEGISLLSESDIQNIEQGVDRYDYSHLPKFRTQVEDFLISYQRYVKLHDPNSSSMVQRFEYWRTSLILIKQNPVFGVGTGDLPKAFEGQYLKMNSQLAGQYRLRSHNQYLSITVAFGVVGLAWFLFAMVYPGIKTGSFKNYFYVIFWIILMVSMLTEDTIESQEGVTFYVLFTALMIFGRENEETSELLLD